MINLLNNKSRNYRTKKSREWKLISCLERFSFFINSNQCNECVNSRYNAKDIVLKRKKNFQYSGPPAKTVLLIKLVENL